MNDTREITTEILNIIEILYNLKAIFNVGIPLSKTYIR